jgi:hypothetical protein
MKSRQLANVLPLVAGLSAAALGCGPADVPDAARVGTSEEAIAGGYTDTKDVAVVGVIDVQAGAMCSGSLIAPNLVLTARHCVAPVLNELSGGVSCQVTKFGANHPATSFYVTTKKSFSQNPADYHTVQKVESVPVGATAPFCGSDAAILVLSKGIDPAEAKPLVPRVDTVLEKGEEYYAVGYGATDGNGAGAGLRRRRDNLFVDCVGASCPADITPAYLHKTEFKGDQGTCEGDSGGPAFDLQGRVVGITSRGDKDCTMSIYTQVFGWGEWIKQMGVEAAKLGGYDPMPWSTGWPTDPAYADPVGAACQVDGDCPASRCASDPAGSYCTRLCDDAAPCPDGYQCDAEQKACLRVPPPPAEPPSGAGGGAAQPAGSAKADPNASGDGGSTGGCSIRRGTDPTKPAPWFAGAVAAAALLARRRRR